MSHKYRLEKDNDGGWWIIKDEKSLAYTRKREDADEILKALARDWDEVNEKCNGMGVCDGFPDMCDISDCCGKPITLDKDSCTQFAPSATKNVVL